MQTYKDGEAKSFIQGETSELAKALEEKMEAGEADYAVIGKMPDKGEEIEINGLKFSVQQITKSGNIILEPSKYE